MNGSNQVEIAMSKLKLILLLIGSIGFVVMGAWTIYRLQYIANPSLPKQVLTIFFGTAAVLFFGYIGFFIIKKINDKTPGLIISNEGVTDNSSAVSAGFIPWSDVVGITDFRVFHQKFVSIDLKNPQGYIEKQDSTIKRKAMQFNQTTYGTPISISANALECNHNKLKAMLKSQFNEYKKKKA
jgi:hypothetical protein